MSELSTPPAHAAARVERGLHGYAALLGSEGSGETCNLPRPVT